MPYLVCPGCRLSVYSAASYSTNDHCPRCGARRFAGSTRPAAALRGESGPRGAAEGKGVSRGRG